MGEGRVTSGVAGPRRKIHRSNRDASGLGRAGAVARDPFGGTRVRRRL